MLEENTKLPKRLEVIMARQSGKDVEERAEREARAKRILGKELMKSRGQKDTTKLTEQEKLQRKRRRDENQAYTTYSKSLDVEAQHLEIAKRSAALAKKIIRAPLQEVCVLLGTQLTIDEDAGEIKEEYHFTPEILEKIGEAFIARYSQNDNDKFYKKIRNFLKSKRYNLDALRPSKSKIESRARLYGEKHVREFIWSKKMNREDPEITINEIDVESWRNLLGIGNDDYNFPGAVKDFFSFVENDPGILQTLEEVDNAYPGYTPDDFIYLLSAYRKTLLEMMPAEMRARLEEEVLKEESLPEYFTTDQLQEAGKKIADQLIIDYNNNKEEWERTEDSKLSDEDLEGIWTDSDYSKDYTGALKYDLKSHNVRSKKGSSNPDSDWKILCEEVKAELDLRKGEDQSRK